MDIKNIIFLLLFLSSYSGIKSSDILNNGFPKVSTYSIVHPEVSVRRSRSVNTSPPSQHMFEDEVSYVLQINKRKHILHLKKNRDFLHPKFVQFSRDSSGSYISSYPDKRVHCYYHGEVEGYEDSLAAVSTCSGLRGVIYLGNETFALEPVPQSSTNDHILYPLRDVQTGPGTVCGVVSGNASMPHYEYPAQSLTSLLRRRRNLPQTSYVELVLVVDNLRYNFKKQNSTAVTDEMVEMANLLDGYYKPLNIRVVLVGLEIFTSENPFSVEGSAGDVLGRFVRWRKSTLIRKIKHDIAQLVVGRPSAYDGGVLGMAYVNSVCSPTTSGGINVFGENNLVPVSKVVAHEMGHNLGMKHDDGRCTCDEGKRCIMGSSGGSAEFSSCSADDFEKLVIDGGGECLRNKPSPSDVVSTAECGNDRLDEGEQCDCGKPEECTNKCCDAATCTFTSGSVCADGDCCSNCQIKVSGTVCRKSVNTCDLPEFCDGESEFCPEDYYVMDGVSCQENAAYCFEGRCQTYDYQCRHLFTPDPATKAADVCFRHANTLGNVFGNCGKVREQEFIKCSVADAMCGKVQCTNVDVNDPPPGAHVSIQRVDGETCVNADFNLGPDVLDPAYVNTGSPCGEGKVCLDFHCVNASALLSDLECDAKKTCSDRGVCNDQGNCHCNEGWAPPTCSTSGRGGSINSGPATIDYSLRNGLLIFFLLVVPVLVCVILLMLFLFRRDSLDPCLKRNRKSQNRNVERASAANAQSENPASTTSAPISGFRFGELDYWNTEVSHVPSKPAAPVQGPGGPKPAAPVQGPGGPKPAAPVRGPGGPKPAAPVQGPGVPKPAAPVQGPGVPKPIPHKQPEV